MPFGVAQMDHKVGRGAARHVQQSGGAEVHVEVRAVRHLGLGRVVHDHASLLVAHGPIDHRSVSGGHVHPMNAAGERHGPSAPCAIDWVFIAGWNQHGTAVATKVDHGQRSFSGQASGCRIEAHHVSCA